MDNKHIKNKIKHYVKEYIRLFPDEYKIVVDELAIERNKKANKFATVRNSDYTERQLGEIPATLFNMFKMKLTEDEFEWLFSEKQNKGAIWFYKTFKEFSVEDLTKV